MHRYMTIGIALLVLGLLTVVANSAVPSSTNAPGQFIAAVSAPTPGIPSTMNVQGRLTDATGTPLPAGPKTFTFRIFDLAAGGNEVWPGGEKPEEQIIPTDSAGLWNAAIGVLQPLDASVFSNIPRWLEIEIDDGVSGPIVLPRTELVTGPFAFRAGSIDGAAGGTIVGDLVIQDNLTATGTVTSANSITIDGIAHQITSISGAISFDNENLSTTGKVTIGEGHSNTGTYGFVAGNTNTVSGYAATISGGWFNVASGVRTAVAGGEHNRTVGHFSNVGGGRYNRANADYSVIAGGGGASQSDSNAALGVQNAIGGGARNRTDSTGSTIAGGLDNRAIGVNATIGGGRFNRAFGDYSVVAGGGSDVEADSNTARGDYAAIGGGRNNQAGGTCGSVAGGYNNRANGEYSTATGGLECYAQDTYATVGGGFGHRASGWMSTIGGGGGNRATDTASTVCGGRNNFARSIYATVAGGGGASLIDSNSAMANHSFIGGGLRNITKGGWSVVCGGFQNTTSHVGATVGGGVTNVASGRRAVVPGGWDNVAAGDNSLAAGRRAKANNLGSFVWGDSFDGDVSSSADNQFTARTSGGARFFSNTALTTGVALAAGGGSWGSVSDRNVKENIRPIDGTDLLQKLSAIPITEWNYISQDDAVRHIGPMAQDFHAAFGVGEDDTHITTIDAQGIALAAIQELNKRNEALQADNSRLEAQLTEQQSQIDQLRNLLDGLARKQ